MNQLTEQSILCKGMVYILLPISIFATLSMIFPKIYALFPVQESTICLCSFYAMEVNGSDYFIWEIEQSDFASMTLANSISFYIVNWVALVILIWLVFRIRHTGDDTYLKLECIFIVGIWVVFSLPQYATFFYNYYVAC